MRELIDFSQNNGSGPAVCGRHGWILYTPSESVRNRSYIDLYRTACQKHGMSIALGVCEPDRWSDIEYEKVTQIVTENHPAYVVNRTRSPRLAALLEAAGVRVFNQETVCRLGNDKEQAYRYMEQCGIPVLPTMYGVCADTKPKQYPFVVKSVDGHGGTEVYRILDAGQWHAWLQTAYDQKKRYVMQEFADAGRDLRVYIVGGAPVAAVLRTCENDFRSNYSLGGHATLVKLGEKERALTARITKLLAIDMAGIDFVFRGGQPYFNELEDMVGARMLYALSDYDIVDTYVTWICGQVCAETAQTVRK